MGLLKPKKQRGRAIMRASKTIDCPLNGHQVSWCRGLCEPSALGKGLCGRDAPHAMVGRTQAAIIAFKAKERAAAK